MEHSELQRYIALTFRSTLAGVLVRSVIMPFYLQCNKRFAKPSNHTIDDGKGAATTPRIKLLNHGDGVISAQYYFNV